jgi:hypothetical protein
MHLCIIKVIDSFVDEFRIISLIMVFKVPALRAGISGDSFFPLLLLLSAIPNQNTASDLAGASLLGHGFCWRIHVVHLRGQKDKSGGGGGI